MRNLLAVVLLSALLCTVQASRKLGETLAVREGRQLSESSSQMHVHAPYKKLPSSDSTTTSTTSATVFATGTEADFAYMSGSVISSYNIEPISEDPVSEVNGSPVNDGNRRHLSYKPELEYHGGPYMKSGAYQYLIFASGYSSSTGLDTGDGWSNATISAIENFIQGIGSTSVFQHLKAYGVKPKTSLLGSYAIKLDTDKIVMDRYWSIALVKYVLLHNEVPLPVDPSETIFHVLTDTGLVPWHDEVMCVEACGWHTTFNFTTSRHPTYEEYIYSWIPQPQACELRNILCYDDTYPVNDMYTQSLVSIIYHETIEAMTDFEGNAWYDQRGNEIGDLCAWMYGPVQTYHNASCDCKDTYNTIVGGQHYLIQGTYAIAQHGAKQLGCQWT